MPSHSLPPMQRASLPAMALILAAVLLAPPACHSQVRPRPSPPIAAPPGSRPSPRPVPPPGQPQMRVHDFSINASGIRLERTTLANGRVKAPPFSVSDHRLEFEVFNAKGAKVYTGSLDHPLWQQAEAENPQAPGQRQQITRARPHWVFHIRLPVETAGTRVAFFEVKPTAGQPESRQALGEVLLSAPAQARSP